MLTILIADDESIERNYLQTVFTRYRDLYQVVALAENGEQAVRLFNKHRPEIIIMDINMPLLNGIDAAKRIRQDVPGQIIILNSAYAEFEFAKQAVENGIDSYLLKPTNEETILSTIAACVNKKKLNGEVSVNLTKKSIINYPFEIVDHLLEAITSNDINLLKSNITLYLNFLKLQQQEFDQYRLHILNTIFSVQRILSQGRVPESLLALLDSPYFLQAISRSLSWYEIRSETAKFFNRLILVFESLNPACKDGMDAVVRYIEKNFSEDITLDSLARYAHFSPAYLSRTFHEKMKITIRSYINQQRIKHALYLLQHSDQGIRDIAGSCGFKNLSHFHRVFKEHTGKTPVQAKKKENE